MLASLKPGGAHNDISLNALQGDPKGERSESNPHVPCVSSGFSALCGFKLPAPITPTYCSNTRRLARCDIEIPVTIPILNLMLKRRNARFIHPFQQDCAYDQSIIDAFFIAAFFLRSSRNTSSLRLPKRWTTVGPR